MQRRKQAILVAGATVAVLFVALLATLAFRPALVLGIDGGTLAHSVDAKLPSIGDPSPVVASQPLPAMNPVAITGLPTESNSPDELVPVMTS